MVEAIVSASLAVVTGGFILTTRINSRIDSVSKRVDEVELCMARSYISKKDFASTMERVEAHMIRIEDKLDELVLTQTRPRWYLNTHKERSSVTFVVSSLNKNEWELLKTGRT